MPRTQVLEAVVRVRADTRQAQRGLQQMGRGWQAMTNWTQRMRQGLMGANQMLSGQGAIMVAGGLAIRSAIRNYENYSRQVAMTRSILSSSNMDMRTQTYLLQAADASSRRYGYAMDASAEAMNTLYETGVEAHEAMRYFGTVTEFSRAANVDLNTSARVLVDSMRQFNMQSEAGARQLAGAFTVAGRLSSTSIEELQQAFRYASVEMSGLGYNANETIASLAGLSAIGLRSTTAGTRLRGMLASLHTVTDVTRERVDELGASSEELDSILYDETGTLRPLVDATERLSTFFAELPNQAARNEIAIRIFGRRSLAAGVMLSRMHARGEDWLGVARAINDEEEVSRLLHEAAEQNMRSFAAQMDLARRSAQEFGITFMEILLGPMAESRQGFGQWLTDLALATRGADETNLMTGEMLTTYQQLSPEMRQTGRELRQTMAGLAELLRILGQVGIWFGRIAGANPKVAAGFLLVGSAIRPLIPLMMEINAQAAVTGSGAAGLSGRLMNLGRAGGFARLGLQALIVDLAGRGSQALTGRIAEMMGLNAQLVEARENLPAWVQAFGALPVLGPWIEQLGIGVDLIREAWNITQSAREQEASDRAREVQIAQQAAERGPEERIRSQEREHMNDMRALASSLYRENIRGERHIATVLRMRHDMSQEEANTMGEQLDAFQRQAGAGYIEAEGRPGTWRAILRGIGVDVQGARSRELLEEVRQSQSELARLQHGQAMRAVTAEQARREAEITGEEFGIAARPPLRALAELPETPFFPEFGPPAPTTVEFAPEVTVAPTQLEIDLNLTLEADGREMATVVGRHLQTVTERRGGVSIRPGSTRRVTETGAP